MSVLTPLQLSLLNKRTIEISGYVNNETAQYVYVALLMMKPFGNPDMEVIINSQGGNATAGFYIYDLFTNYKGGITGTVAGKAQSIAAIILQACDIRRCYKHSDLLIHNPSPGEVGWGNFFDENKLEATRKVLIGVRDKMYAILQEKTGKSFDEIAEECARDADMDPQKALKFGLIDEIL